MPRVPVPNVIHDLVSTGCNRCQQGATGASRVPTGCHQQGANCKYNVNLMSDRYRTGVGIYLKPAYVKAQFCRYQGNRVEMNRVEMNNVEMNRDAHQLLQ